MRPSLSPKKTLVSLLVFSLWVICPLEAFAQALPSYQSTDNTGKGRQERFEAIENYLVQVAAYSKSLEQRLQAQDDTKIKELEQKQAELLKEVEGLKGQNQALRREIELIRGAVGNLSRTDFTKIQEFVERLEGGEWDKAQQDIEGLKLTARSLEAIIEDLVQQRSGGSRP